MLNLSLFLIYINNLTEINIEKSVYLFVDNTFKRKYLRTQKMLEDLSIIKNYLKVDDE